MKTIKLDFATAIRNAWKAYDEGRLGAQNGFEECLYDYSAEYPEKLPKVVVCAIGASIKVERRYNADTVERLFDDGVIAAPPSDRNLLIWLQELHDRWAESNGSKPQSLGEGLSGRWPDVPTWVETWVEKNRGREINGALFVSFLEEAEKHI